MNVFLPEQSLLQSNSTISDTIVNRGGQLFHNHVADGRQISAKCECNIWFCTGNIVSEACVKKLPYGPTIFIFTHRVFMVYWGIPSPDGIPYGLADFFFLPPFFFFRRTFGGHLWWSQQRIGLKFCRTILMDSLQVQLKNGLAEVIFHWVIWVKLLKKAFRKS